MNTLFNLSRIRRRFRRTWPQYWLDRLVEQYTQEWNDGLYISGQVLGILRHPASGEELIIPGVNIVTNDGDLYYAESICGETPTDDFDAAASGLRMGSSATSPTKTDVDVTTFLSNTALALDGTYPQTNDADGDNTGSGTDIVTWRYSYGTGDGNDNGIQEGAIADNRTTPTAVLTHFLFAASFNKTASDTLKVFVNHTVNGV